MRSGSESDVRQGIQEILERIAPGRFTCTERKTSSGKSAIGKPVDLQVSFRDDRGQAVIAIEVANVNTTQLVGETCRLYYDSCPLKLMVLGDRNVPHDGKVQCERLLAKLYGQDDIRGTPARVVRFDEDDALEAALKYFLLIRG
ncbi:MAG: hypothetical protein ABSC62_13895 [Terracidiphilus sp.]|jgi:hypothetical protein